MYQYRVHGRKAIVAAIIVVAIMGLIMIAFSSCAPAQDDGTSSTNSVSESVRGWSYGNIYRLVDPEYRHVCYGMASGSIVCYDTTP